MRILPISVKVAIVTSLLFNSAQFYAAPSLSSIPTPQTVSTSKPLITPSPPTINAQAFILIDANSGKIIAEKNSEKKLQPASLTKMMTLYVISNALRSEQIHLTDNVHISHDAWKTGGSRMFVKQGQDVPI